VHDDRLNIDTPEQVALELPIAGVGSRFLAVAVDTLLQSVLAFGGLIALAIATPLVVMFAPVWLVSIGPAILVLYGFCLFWGYFAFFEILWSGRTPGKRLAGIRVIKESGRPITPLEAMGRNIVRSIDFLPVFYALGVLVMLFNHKSRRLGDFVAGTIVVHDAAGESPRPEVPAAAERSVSQGAVTRVSQEELRLIETYLRRRFDLDPTVRDEMAAQIASRIQATTGLSPEAGQTVDEFLQGVARTVRDTARFR
jgi:uncharacterized RDD family membrane protein YckC